MDKVKVRKKRVGKNQEEVKYHVLSYRLNGEEYKKIKKLASKSRHYISNLTRWAVQAYLDKNKIS